MRETRVRSLGREDPLEKRKWQLTPVLLPGESHGQRSLVGYSPRGGKESDTTEQLHFTKTVDMYCVLSKDNICIPRILSLFIMSGPLFKEEFF